MSSLYFSKTGVVM